MPRKKTVSFKRKITPDSTYGSVEASKFINCMMLDGKKSVSEKEFYGAILRLLERIKSRKPELLALPVHEGEGVEQKQSKKKKDSQEEKAGLVKSLFSQILDRVKPALEVKSKRIGGATYQIPSPVAPSRSLMLAIRWIVDAARKRKDKDGMNAKLASEFYDILVDGKGEAMKKRETVQKMAEANKAFSHYA